MAVQRSWFRQRLVLTCIVSVVAISGFATLSSCGGNDTQSLPTVNVLGPIDPAVAKSLYSAKCGICHGSDGAMKYAGAKDLSISTLPRAEVLGQVTYGKGTMPPMNGQLNDQQIEAVVDYCISLRKQ